MTEAVLVIYKIVWADGGCLEFKAPTGFLETVKGQSSFLLPAEEFPCLVSMAAVRYISETVSPPHGRATWGA